MRLVNIPQDKIITFYAESDAAIWKDLYPKDNIKRTYGARVQLRKLIDVNGNQEGFEILLHDLPNNELSYFPN